jgi:tRNA pseudouridine55 synthase
VTNKTKKMIETAGVGVDAGAVLSNVVLIVDKPTGMTSFDVVRRVRRAAGVRQVGHGGTLDPLASGVLPVCLGEATKLAQFLLDADKEYDVVVRLGAETDTDDAAGRVVREHATAGIDETVVRAALGPFRGAIEQIPPAFSALKRAGRPLYAYARAGEPIPELAPRRVSIHALELVEYRGPEAVSLRVRCSKGTYVRALARDLGHALGVGGHVTALRRTRSGPFALADARPLPEVLDALVARARSDLPLVTPAAALAHLEPRVVAKAMADDLRAGRRVGWEAAAGEGTPAQRLCLLDDVGDLVAVAEPRADGTLRTLRVFGVRH